MNVESGFQLGDVAGFVRRRVKSMLIVAGVITLAAYWLAMALPNEYESSSTILVEPQMVNKELVEAGVLRGVIDRTFPLAEIAQAHRYVELGTKAGDVIVTIP